MLWNQRYVKFFHVLYSKEDEKWHVKEEKSGTISAYDRKSDAINSAVQLAESGNFSKKRVIIHKQNEAFEPCRIM